MHAQKKGDQFCGGPSLPPGWLTMVELPSSTRDALLFMVGCPVPPKRSDLEMPTRAITPSYIDQQLKVIQTLLIDDPSRPKEVKTENLVAIASYTLEAPFYKLMNGWGNTTKRSQKEMSFVSPYVRLLIESLRSLPERFRYEGFGVRVLDASVPDLKKAWDNYKEHFKVGRPVNFHSVASFGNDERLLGDFLEKSDDNPVIVLQCERIVGYQIDEISMIPRFGRDAEGEVLMDAPSFFKVEREPIKIKNYVIVHIKYEEQLSKEMSYLTISPTPEIPKTTPITPKTTPITTKITPEIPKIPKMYNFIKKFGSKGSGNGQFYEPRSVAIDANGNIVVADKNNHRIQVFGADGKFIWKFGSKGSGNGQFDLPVGVTIDTNGNFIICDINNNQIQVFGADGKFIQKLGRFGTGDSEFNGPRAVSIDLNGNTVVSDCRNHRIQVFSPDGSFMKKFGSDKLDYPRDIAFRDGNILVADCHNNRIAVFGSDGIFIQKFPAEGKIFRPIGIAIDHTNGNVVVADNVQIQVFGATGKLIQKLGRTGSGDGEFKRPCGIAIDAYGNLIVADCENHRIQVFGKS